MDMTVSPAGNSSVTSWRRYRIFASTTLKWASRPPYGFPGVPSTWWIRKWLETKNDWSKWFSYHIGSVLGTPQRFNTWNSMTKNYIMTRLPELFLPFGSASSFSFSFARTSSARSDTWAVLFSSSNFTKIYSTWKFYFIVRIREYVIALSPAVGLYFFILRFFLFVTAEKRFSKLKFLLVNNTLHSLFLKSIWFVVKQTITHSICRVQCSKGNGK